MRKFYSLVLMATALLLGTNAWANATFEGLENDKGANKISVKIGSTTKYTNDLQTAVDAVEAGQTAEITVLEDLPLTSTVLLSAETLTSDPKNITLTVPENVTISSTDKAVFAILKNYLEVKGKGSITVGQSAQSWNQAAFVLFGSATNTDSDWTKLTIREGIKVTAGIGIEVFDSYQSNPFASSFPVDYKTWWGSTETKPANFFVSQDSQKQSGCAFGVNVLIEGSVYGKKYGVQVTGHINQTANQWDAEHYPGTQFPTITIASTASVTCAATQAEGGSAAIYGSGYAVWNIAGTVSGNSGLYLKAGDVTLDDATIAGTGTYVAPQGSNSGIAGAGGSAITIESNVAYSGDMAVEINGDTKVTSDDGYAIQEKVTTSNNTLVSSIVINGGTLNGGDEGAIIISKETVTNPETDVVIYGGNFKGTTTVEGTEGTLEDLLPKDSEEKTHITQVTDPVSGKITLVVSDGDAPAVLDPTDPTVPTPWSWCAANEQSGKNVAWTALEDAQIASGTITLGELQIISGTGTTESTRQQLTIADGATLQVKHLIMNDYARIIVKAGGKLIVTGDNGIIAPNVANILLESSESKQAYFLFSPEVSSNKYPNATVEFKSKAYLNGSKGVFQRFGVPTWDRESETKNTVMVSTGAAKTWITQYDYSIDDWAAWTAYNNATNITITNARPFRGYMLYSNNDKDHKMAYEFAGNLIGNQNEDLHMYYGWNYFANSYTAPISIKDLINTVMASLDADKKDYVLGTIYLYKNTGDDDYTWSGVNLSTPKQAYEIVDGNPVVVQNQVDIQPMQAFLMRLNLIGGQMDQPISYKYDVYNPNMGIANNNKYLAPARAAQANNEMHVLVSGEGSWDKVYVVENNNFSNDFENGYDAYKYDGKTGVNLYAMNSDARMEILATDDAEGTFLGIDAPKAGNYTLHVAGVEGMEYAIVDMETNAVINAVNGTKYQFYANAGANDYRFQVVKAAKLPTAIDNTEAGKSVKGVYTLTGQFLGNDVNVLPAGVYIVNGVKVVK